MREFKVKKGVSKEPLVWGLNLGYFAIFVCSLIFGSLYMTAGLTFKKLFVTALLIGLTYMILNILTHKNIVKTLFSQKIPDILKNS